MWGQGSLDKEKKLTVEDCSKAVTWCQELQKITLHENQDGGVLHFVFESPSFVNSFVTTVHELKKALDNLYVELQAYTGGDISHIVASHRNVDQSLVHLENLWQATRESLDPMHNGKVVDISHHIRLVKAAVNKEHSDFEKLEKRYLRARRRA